MVSTGKKFGYDFKIVKATIDINKLQRKRFINSIKKYYKKKLKNRKFALWGASFKPNTDDMRDAPSIDIINSLLKEQTTINLYDPVAIAEAKKIFKNKINYFNNAYDALKKCDALIVVTDWNEFKQVNMQKVKSMI